MKGEKRLQVLIIVLICCLLPVMPFQGYAADLTISDITTATGDFSVNGIIHATSLGGDGSGLTNVTASALSCTGCVTPPQLNFTPGTVTSVGAGTGLTGGPVTTVGTLSVLFGGNGAASTVSRSDHSHVETDPKVGTLTANQWCTSNSSGTQVTCTQAAPAPANHTHDDIYQKKYAQVAVVDAMGRGDYYSPVTAMNDVVNWCGNPTEINPCMVKIMPGFYDVSQSSVTMHSYVDIEGSGENVTIIDGNTNSNLLGVVNAAGNAEIRFLTVRNRGGGAIATAITNSASPNITNVTAIASGGMYNYGVLITSSSPVMTNVTASASGGTDNYGVYNYSSSPMMNNVTATASGGINNYGVYNASSSSPTMINVTATAPGGTGKNHGIHNSESSPTMINVTATASGGTDSYGVYNDHDANFPSTMSNVSATASGGTYNFGVYNNYSSAKMSNVTATASGGTDSYGIGNIYSSPTIFGAKVSASGGTKSFGIYNTHSSPTVDTATITASGASDYNYGIFNQQASTAYLMNVTSNASGGVDSFGILNADTGASMTVDHCRLSGQRSVRNDNSSATIFIGSSKLNGDIIATGPIKCVGAYDWSYSAITCP